MMKGKVTQWVDERGFGFIKPEDGSEKLFFHVSSVKTNIRRPQVGDTVLYESMRDGQQRLKAKGVVIEGVANTFCSASESRYSHIDLPRKTSVDYLAIIVGLASLVATGREFYRTYSIEDSWPFSIPAIVAFIILSRQKKPKDTTFQCSRCRKVTEHDRRTIQAWNNGFIKLYCQACHLKWLESNPRPVSYVATGSKGGCLGVLTLTTLIPVLTGLGIFQWWA
jgi:cold shock CspA family protein